jgi:hypothetical protein
MLYFVGLAALAGEHHSMDEILLERGASVFIRNDDIKKAQYRAFSISPFSVKT